MLNGIKEIILFVWWYLLFLFMFTYLDYSNFNAFVFISLLVYIHIFVTIKSQSVQYYVLEFNCILVY